MIINKRRVKRWGVLYIFIVIDIYIVVKEVVNDVLNVDFPLSPFRECATQ